MSCTVALCASTVAVLPAQDAAPSWLPCCAGRKPADKPASLLILTLLLSRLMGLHQTTLLSTPPHCLLFLQDCQPAAAAPHPVPGAAAVSTWRTAVGPYRPAAAVQLPGRPTAASGSTTKQCTCRERPASWRYAAAGSI
jgi:hypothetical protein